MAILKRTSTSIETAASRPARRIKPTPTSLTPLRVLNLEDGETIHQQCLLLKGECPAFDNSDYDYIRVRTSDDVQTAKNIHSWPVKQGKWKAMIILSPGTNTVKLELLHASSVFTSLEFQVVHQPLLQLPPLHLAVLVAKDSPLLIDCPPAKYGAFSSTHRDLDAVVAKFRTTAYMWQALTADDLHTKGLGRRSFRIEEEWTTDTTPGQSSSPRPFGDVASSKSLPKIHIIRSDKMTAQIRNPNWAQQNPNASKKEALHDMFKAALAQHGPPFDSSCRPVVAGLILDSHYSIEEDLILGHAALGEHNRNGLSLGIFGSHLTYSWPRFLGEISDCLIDEMPTGDTVGNDNGECNDMAHACSVGQGAFLHEVGHAFGADHTTGIMARGYSQDWSYAFIANGKNEHDCNWDLQDALRFKTMPHFRLPGDEVPAKGFLTADIKVDADSDEGEDRLVVSSSAGLARLSVTDGTHTKKYDMDILHRCNMWGTTELSDFNRTQPLEVTALARNGKQKIVKDAWRLFSQRTYIDLPNGIRLQKRSIKSDELEQAEDADKYLQWTAMLAKPGPGKNTYRPATSIDLRVGCTFDGAVVHYSDSSHTNCGPAFDSDGEVHHFGGHASESHNARDMEIVKVEVNKASHGSLDGIRMTLKTGETWGEINQMYGGSDGIQVLEPPAGQKILGFFGTSHKPGNGWGFTEEFGIISGPEKLRFGEEWAHHRELRNQAEDVQVRERPS